ncbi:MAG: ankyrin repeat domain-containing protein [Planctomycetaceae bacterium]|nr:ankyrin repeat domain-containing protein [Planctomycetaceae bacterium]
MAAFARGCLEFLVVWAMAAVGLYFVFEPRFSPPGPAWACGVGGFLVAAGWGLVRNAWIARGQASLIRDSLAGAIPRSGRPYAAIGHALPTQFPLFTPFRHVPCVLYSYELSERKTVRIRDSKGGSRTENRKLVFMSGLGMTHWYVKTSNGEVSVCGFPVPDQFAEEVVDAASLFTRMQEFCAETRFEKVGKWEIGKMLNFAQIVLRQSSGPVREDLWFEGADEKLESRSALRDCHLIEQLIRVDEQVCVIGKFDQQVGGLVNDFNQGGLQVLAGDANQALKHLKQTVGVYLFFAAISISIGTLGAFGLLTLRERDINAKQPLIDASKGLLDAFEAEDWTAFSQQLQQEASPNAKDSVGRPLLLAAIARRRTQAIDLLLEAGADVNAAQDGWGNQPLDAAFDRNQQDLLRRLLALGAIGTFADATSGQPLTTEISEIRDLLNQYTQAEDQADAALMEQISDQWPRDYLESVGRGLYKDTRPVDWSSVKGYRKDNIATVVAEGSTKSGSYERYVVTIRLIDGKWKLRRVHFDDRLEFEFAPSQLQKQ